MPHVAASLRVEGAGVRFRDTPALQDVDVDVGAGAAVALVGPSGAGKSTLLRLFAGALSPTTGTASIDGTPWSALDGKALRRARTRIGFVHQDLALIPNLRVVSNVVAGSLGTTGILGALRTVLRPRRADVHRAHALLERVGIADKLFERTDTLSGGQQQRVAVARALFQQPAVLLADEPVSSVDPARARDTVELLTRISREDGLTLVMSIHNLELARAFFPRIVGLRRGRVAFDAATETLDEAVFEALYTLDQDEMLADGA